MRRNFRPFFLDPKSGAPLPSKRYYDLASWLTTQLTFSFAAAPFLILGFSDSLLAWSRVYFYAVVGTAVLMVFFASPATKKFFRNELERKSGGGNVKGKEKEKNGDGKDVGTKSLSPVGRGEDMSRSASSDSLASRTPVMGITQDLEREFDDAMTELRAAGVEMKHRKGK